MVHFSEYVSENLKLELKQRYQNVNVACFARNVECYFFCDFQTLFLSFKKDDEAGSDFPRLRCKKSLPF